MPEEYTEAGYRASERRIDHRNRARLGRIAEYLERIGGAVLCTLIVVTPWLFGTTENWSVGLMNIGAFSAGFIFFTAWVLNNHNEGQNKVLGDKRLKSTFFVLNFAVLAFCAVALLNARATFSVEDRTFDYREQYSPSLPTTYDANLTRETLINLSAFCVVFWALRYWLSKANQSRRENDVLLSHSKRLQTLLWLVSLNGCAIALQGILQRLSGSAKLLWIRDSWWGSPNACFGPFSYRGNAAEYLNLIWPLALGFWWVLSKERKRRLGSRRFLEDGPELILIPASVIMVVGSVISLSRGGAVVALTNLFGLGTLFALQRNVSNRARIGVATLFILIIGLVTFLGAGPLLKRFINADLKDIGGRAEIYQNAKEIAKDYPVFGTGPGAFQSVYHLYRAAPQGEWHVFAHDDWLETRIAYGWVGFALIIANLLVLCAWIFIVWKPASHRSFAVSAGTGLIGALVHAKFDFPFQTYSIFFTFVIIAGILTSPARAYRRTSESH